MTILIPIHPRAAGENHCGQRTNQHFGDIANLAVTGGCFIKGTRVHTKDGLKPIEEIKVGDYVLSSPEDGTGSPEYKRVVNTLMFENKTICEVQIFGPDPATEYFVGSTGKHPFWVEGVGWTAAELLKKGKLLRKADGTFAEVARMKLVYRTENEGVGWINNLSGDIRTSYGSIFDYANYKPIPQADRDHYLARDVYESDDPYLKVNVYNLEVEDFHTYYVGAQGYWVRTTDCANCSTLQS